MNPRPAIAAAMLAIVLAALAACGPGKAPAIATPPTPTPGPGAAAGATPPATGAATPSAGAVGAKSTAPAGAAQPKPDFPTLKLDTFDGAHYDLAAHRGRWVVVNFWATWCAPCLKEIPGLAALDKARADVDVIGLAYEEIEHADMVAFLKEHPIPYPIAVLDVYAPPADFETPRGLPMTYLIAPDGRVARTFLGPVEAADIEAAIGKKSSAG